MPKYRMVIEIETDKKLKFPTEAQLLADMEAQCESLHDGTYGTTIDVKTISAKCEVVSE